MILLALALVACQTPAEPQDPGPTEAASAAPAVAPFALDPVEDPDLSELSEQAIDAAPSWLRRDLELAFRRLNDDTREELAALIVDLDDPWSTDELAFSIAHLSPEALEDEDFDPQLLVENVAWIPQVDAELAYVELVDSGTPGVDEDYQTTVRYTVDVDGVLQTVELDPELYYWYIVHPRIEDERPLYIDAWEACSRRGLECPTTAEEGAFWRGYLWQGAAADCPEGEWCPVLEDAMAEATYLWSTTGGGVGAVGAIASFMLDSDETLGRWLNFGAGSERSIQPNRIYGLGAGNCGEWADMTTALSRVALIPNYNVVPSSWDHTWNAFYDPQSERWVRWEPVNWWFDHAYGAPYANHATRGDARVLMVTEDDTDSWFTLQVVVSDEAGQPVDGAVVSVYSPYEDTYWWYAGEAHTDETGTASFTLTAGADFAYRVDSPIGSYPSRSNQIDYAASGVAAGETTAIAATVDGTLEAPTSRVTADPDAEPNATLRISGSVDEGRLIGESVAYSPDTFTVEAAAPAVRWFLTDEQGYEAWLDGMETAVLAEGLLGEEATAELDTRKGRVLVVVNEDTLSTAALGSYSFELEAIGAGPEAMGWSEGLVLPPGDHRAVVISGGD